MEPEDINIGAVVRRTEPDFMMVECFNRQASECILSPACELQDVLRRATLAYLAELDKVTLADLLRNGNSLRKLAGIEIHSKRKAETV
jgi:Rrf2 family nitric oxide-sensitive transcriptional repressor